jgi:hypothetical protein
MKVPLWSFWSTTFLGSKFLLASVGLAWFALVSGAPGPGHAAPSFKPSESLALTPSPSPTPDLEQRLQIEQLNQETGWQGEIRGYLPGGSALVALAAAAWGAIIYFRDQRRDRKLRTEQEIASNLNQIIAYSKGEITGSAQVISSLANLNALADQANDRERLINRITDVVVTAIKEDINFNDARQVRFDVQCLTHYQPYQDYVKAHCDENEYIIYRYLSALRALRDRQYSYVSKVTYDASANEFTHPERMILKPEEDFQLLQRLLQGTRRHWLLLSDVIQREKIIERFTQVSGNISLAQQLLRTT